ncbi:MBL fold metallo-hydrolase [Olivibacter sp. SDN3]|uniref:MBL fold metallo-hydrolase n=1 Tax=Olivibacter sp. SDN3 TaxID=2764720 RepID=UPI0016517170|nr:MBL fold metallo-hydrolase [Olivibacter sp. SDN3]QNL51767.1 MBL fold metallo-hydrolase [Olivibacter sp. SDN3]
MKQQQLKMQQVYPDLWLSQPVFPEPKDWPDLKFHAFLLKRDEGNILFYTGDITENYDDLEALGGVKRHYLSHDHEVGPGLATIKARFGNTLHTHSAAEPLAKTFTQVDETFHARGHHPDGIEVIPCPGHTAGSACYLTRASDGRSYLFIGDTIYPSGGKWEALVDESDREQFLQSIELLAKLEPDVVLFGATMPDKAFHEFTPQTWRNALKEAVQSLDNIPVRNGYDQ